MKQSSLWIPLRDGVRLHATVSRSGPERAAPVVLVRTPYDQSAAAADAAFYVAHGYCHVVQSCRGCYQSEGQFYPWHQEAADGYDTLEWLGRQPWCDGHVGMVGGSYEGLVQWLAAARGSAFLKAIVPMVCAADFWHELNYMGGAFRLGLSLMWATRMWHRRHRPESAAAVPPLGEQLFPELFDVLPLSAADAALGARLDCYHDWLAHPDYDAYWEVLSNRGRYDRLAKVPALIIGGWFDAYAGGSFANYAGLAAAADATEAAPHRLLMGAWRHGDTVHGQVSQVAERDFGPDLPVDVRVLVVEWFDRWLRGGRGRVRETPAIRYFTMGRNRWQSTSVWPPAASRETAFYLSAGALSTELPEGTGSSTFIYDPANPVPTLGSYCIHPERYPEGPHDQRQTEARADVLVFTSAVLCDDLEVSGPVQLILFASSTAVDTDFVARLTDVFPDGASYNLCEGIIRARYRQSWTQPSLLNPGEVYRFRIDLQVTSNVFERGHRLRLQVTSSNFPQFDRHPNTGAAFGTSSEIAVAAQTIYHDQPHASHLLLPVVP